MLIDLEFVSELIGDPGLSIGHGHRVVHPKHSPGGDGGECSEPGGLLWLIVLQSFGRKPKVSLRVCEVAGFGVVVGHFDQFISGLGAVKPESHGRRAGLRCDV